MFNKNKIPILGNFYDKVGTCLFYFKIASAIPIILYR